MTILTGVALVVAPARPVGLPGIAILPPRVVPRERADGLRVGIALAVLAALGLTGIP